MEENTFSSFGLSPDMLSTILEKGFEEPTEIQRKIIPLILDGDLDLIGQAQTGTGKTAAFAIPILEMLSAHASTVQALVLVPTRELAIQVAEEFNSLKGDKDLHIAPIYGGQSYDIQFRHLKKGVDIVIGTPGRVIDHLNRGSLAVNDLSFIVLDEADEMLNMGFVDDIEDILGRTGERRRTLLFSATMPERISKLAKKFMKEREIVKTKLSGKTTSLTDQIYYEVNESDKLEALCRIIDTTNEFYGIVFCRTKRDVDFLSTKLHDRDYDAEGLHGDVSQKIREKILGKFREKKVNILVATDVAARGLDIEDLTHVINYALPQDAESYLHRIGRTGRAGKEGAAITFVNHEEFRKLKNITTQSGIRKESLPHIKEVIKFKRDKLASDLKAVLESGTAAEYVPLAMGLLEEYSPELVVSALVKQLYGSQLEDTKYREIGKFKGDEYSPKDKRDDRRKGGRDRDGRGRDDRRRDDRRGEDRRSDDRRREDRFGRDRNRDDRRKDDRVRGEKGKEFVNRDEDRREKKKVKKEKHKERERRGDGGTRLFIAMGKEDNITPVDILKMMKKKADVEGQRISGITINDSYSFFNVPEDDAQTILKKLNPKGTGKRPLVERADPK